MAVDAAVQALAAQHANLDFDHVQPTGVLGDVVEFQAAEQASGFARREGLVKCSGRVGRQIVQHDADALRLGKVNVRKFPHAGGEVDGGTAAGDFDLAPRSMHVEEDEQVGRSVAFVLAVVALELTRLGLDRLACLADELGRAYMS